MRLLLTLLTATSAVQAADMGEWRDVRLGDNNRMQTEEFTTTAKLNPDEVLKVNVYPTGRKNARPSADTPVYLWISARDDRHQWVLPWRPDDGHEQQWLEVLLCNNVDHVQLMAEITADKTIPMRWKVSTENVKLGTRTTRMKSTTADISYRRFSWSDDDNALFVRLDVSVLAGPQVCAFLAVARRCVTHPHELTDDQLLQRVPFARSARLTISRADTPDGFWLYLIPESDNTKCWATAGRGRDALPPAAKTIDVAAQLLAYNVSDDGTTPRPQADHYQPRGDSRAQIEAGDGDWATYGPSDCESRLQECQQLQEQCPLQA